MRNCQCIIVLHGWQSSKEKWNKVKEIIGREGIEMIVPDLPGFKPETKLDHSWNLDNYLDWVEKLVERKKNSNDLTEPFFLLGHSFGGRISIKFAVKHPLKLKGLILVSSAGIRDRKRSVSKLAFLNKFNFLPGYSYLRKFFYRFIVRKTDYLKTEGAMRETFRDVIKEDLRHLLSKIKVRTLILWGEKDKITPMSDANLMKKEIENSELKVLGGIGHAPYIEDPEILAKEILTFIQ